MLNQVLSDNPIVKELVAAVKAKSPLEIQSLATKFREKLSVKDGKGLNAAMYIGKTGDKDACQLFIKFGAKALDCAKGAAFGGYEELARELAGHNSDDYPALCVYAAWGGQKVTTAKLLNRTRTNKSIDPVRICNQIADAAKRGGHTELEKNYIKLAKVRAAKLTVNDEESSYHSPDEVEIVEPSSNTSVSVVTATATKAVLTNKPIALTKPESATQSTPARKSIQVTEPIPTFAKVMATPSNPTAPQREQTPLRNDAPRANYPVAPNSYARPAVAPQLNKPAPIHEKLPTLQANQPQPPVRFLAPAPVQKTASTTGATKRPLNPQQDGAHQSFTIPGLHPASKQAGSEASTSVQQTTEKDKASSPSRSDEEGRKSPIINLYQASKKGRTETPANKPAEEGEIVEPAVSARTLGEALNEIQQLKAKVSMLEIALKNKQTEVADLRQLITKPNQKLALK